MPENLKTEVLELLLDLRPVPEAVVVAPTYANAFRVVQDSNGLTVYFFALPADADSLEPLKDVTKKSKEERASPIRLELPPTAKLFIPPGAVMSLMREISQAYQVWLQTHKG